MKTISSKNENKKNVNNANDRLKRWSHEAIKWGKKNI